MKGVYTIEKSCNFVVPIQKTISVSYNMKKQNINPVLLILITVASLSAFIYLNTVKVNEKSSFGIQYEQPNLGKNIADEDDEEKVKSKTSDISLPGIEAVKSAIVFVKKFIPAS